MNRKIKEIAIQHPEQYKSNLVKFITETRAKKSHPVLLTPVSRRNSKKEKHRKHTKNISPLAIEVATATKCSAHRYGY